MISQNVKEIHPQNQNRWTGHVGSNGYIYDDGIEIGAGWLDTYRSWAKFDLTAIPTTAIITKIDVHLNVTAAGGSYHRCHITDLTNVDPVTASGSSLYSSIYWGQELLDYPAYTTELRTTGHKFITLNSTAITNLQNRINNNLTWWAIGFYEESDAWKAVCDGYSQTNTNEPYAIITFKNDFAEPNETCDNAYNLTLNYSNNNLYLYPGEIDFYKFTYNNNVYFIKVVGYGSTTEGYYGLNVSANNNTITVETIDVGKNPKPDTKVYLYAGNCSTELAFDDDSGTGLFSLINFSSPAVSMISINGCGNAHQQTFSSSGQGLWNDSICGWSVAGQEVIYKFIAPSTGTYSIQVTQTNNSFVDYAWKTGNPYDPNGWTCIDDIMSSGTYGNLQWTAGTTYYILLDDENTSPSTHTFYINCPSNPCQSPTATIQNVTGVGSATLTCNASGGSGGQIMYKWYSGNSCSGTVLGTSSTLNVTATGYYSCKAYISGYESTCFTCATAYATIIPDPCQNIVTIYGCGPNYEQTFIASGGNSAWNAQFCGYSQTGNEQVYSFTPTVTGTYKINVTQNSAGYVDFGYKTGSCSSSGWTCIADVINTGIYGELQLSAGTTYYFITDDEYPSTTGTLKFYLTCPNQLPTISITSPANNSTFTNPNITVTGTANDADGTVSLVQVKLNNGNWENATGTTNWSKSITLVPGQNIIYAKAQDNNNEWSQEVYIIVTYNTPNQPPLISITSPVNGSTHTTPNITVSGTASDNDGSVTLVQVKVNTGTWENATGTTNWTKNVTLQSGTNVIYAKCQDNNGDWSQEVYVNVTYQSPNQLPVVNITSPINGSTTNTPNITVSGTASDNDGNVVLVQVKVNNGTWENAIGTTNWSKNVTLTSGTNIIYAKAQDNNGGWSQEVYISVVYNTPNLPPVVNITYPSNGTSVTSASINVTGTAQDQDGSITIVQVKLNNGNWENATGTTTWSKTLTLVPGTNVIYAKAQDNSGNWSQEAFVTITYTTQNLPPIIVITSPNNNAIVNTLNIIVQGQAVDNDGTVSLVQVKVNNGNWENAVGTSTWSKAVTLVPGGNIIYAKAQDNSGDWSNIVSVNVTSTVGIDNTFSEDLISIYPNPACDFINISILKNYSEYEVSIYNVIGEKIYTFKSNLQNERISLKNFSDGVYFVNITGNEINVNKKIIIKK
ncbi:MAG: Ig-like domain-containing protein [Bacteroidales bacterium]|nr:Ig-like domain-containing protein [Bacteroidales bacterium]